MVQTLSERRMIENEAVFREHNERIKKDFDELKKVAKEEGQEVFISEEDKLLHYYCECSDENCRKRIKLRFSRYNEIHKQRDHFVIVCGHESTKIERVVNKGKEFCIVKKFITPPESAPRLNKTEIDNT